MKTKLRKVGAASDTINRILGSDEDDEDDDVLMSDNEYTAEDHTGLRPSLDAEWDDEEEDDDGDDLDSVLLIAQIQREYAQTKRISWSTV